MMLGTEWISTIPTLCGVVSTGEITTLATFYDMGVTDRTATGLTSRKMSISKVIFTDLTLRDSFCAMISTTAITSNRVIVAAYLIAGLASHPIVWTESSRTESTLFEV
jgi:hypothetical protein